MKIGKGDKMIEIPAWLLVVGILAVDNIVVNTYKLILNNKRLKVIKDLSINEEESE